VRLGTAKVEDGITRAAASRAGLHLVGIETMIQRMEKEGKKKKESKRCGSFQF